MAGAYRDLKTKKVSFSYLYIGVLIGIGCLVWKYQQKEFQWQYLLLGCLPGLLFLGYGKCSGEKIGYGDGLILLIVGFCHFYKKIWFEWCLSLIFITFFSGFLFCFRKVSKHMRIPFLPFLWLADFILWISSC